MIKDGGDRHGIANDEIKKFRRNFSNRLTVTSLLSLREKRRVVARKSHDTDPYSLRIRANPGVSCSMKRDVSAACQEPYFPQFGLFPNQGKSGLRTPP